MLDACLAPFLPGVRDHLGIAAGLEAMSAFGEILRQIREVVDLAIVYHRHAAGFIEHRLSAAGDVDDGEAPVAQRYSGRGKLPVAIRAAMDQKVGHALNPTEVDASPTPKVHNARNPAHDVGV